MKHSFSGKVIGLLLAGLLLAACESVGESVTLRSDWQPVEPGKTVYISVSKALGVRPQDYAQISPLLDRGLRDELILEDVFASVESEPEASDYLLDVEVFESRQVGKGKRAFLGFLAPRSYIRVSAKLRRSGSDEVIQSYQVTGQGARNSWSAQGYGLDDPVRKAVDQIVLLLQGKTPSEDPEADPEAEEGTET